MSRILRTAFLSTGPALEGAGHQRADLRLRPGPLRRSILSGLLLLAPFLLALCPPLGATDFDYPDFSSIAGLSLVGNAVQAGTNVQLTAAVNTQTGGLWHTAPVPVSEGFSTTFEYQITPTTGGADGMAFVIHANGPGALGPGGGSLGYDTLPASLAVELDHYNNGNFNDPNGNHISVHTNGAAPNSTNESASIGIVTAIPDLGGIHTVAIDHDGATMEIRFDGTLVLTVVVDLSTVVGGTDATIGFTGATGGLNEAHIVHSWSYSSAGEILRGDADGDGSVNTGDAVDLLLDLFVAGSDPVACADAADCDDSGGLNVADAIWLLAGLFLPGHPGPMPPHPDCGGDPTSDPLSCDLSICP